MMPVIQRAISLAVIILLESAAHAESSNTNAIKNWKSECIGQYQVSVPGVIEEALDKLTHEWARRFDSYANGEISPFSKLQYAGSSNIIYGVSEADFINYKKTLLINTNKIKQKYLNSSYENQQKWGSEMKDVLYDTSTFFGWGSEDHSPSIYYFLDSKIFSFSFTNNDGNDKTLLKKYFDFVLNGFRLRSLYEIPEQKGICIPYGFIADDGTTPHNIAVTMRLIDHPDVEIGFQDSTYPETTVEHGKLSSGYREPKDAINSFFNNSGVTNNLEKVEPNFPGYHSIKMDGQKGGAVFFTIIREDKSKDYGYIAAVKGDDKAGIPSQLLYVIGTASRAKGKPVNKVELKDMAEKIMASVKKHPVQ